MNVKRSARLAVVAAIASLAVSSPAMAVGPANTTLGAGPVKPVVVWDHAAWKRCYSLTYAQWREDGASIQTSQTAADLTCGTQP